MFKAVLPYLLKPEAELESPSLFRRERRGKEGELKKGEEERDDVTFEKQERGRGQGQRYPNNTYAMFLFSPLLLFSAYQMLKSDLASVL